MGFKEIFPVSAISGSGTGDLLDAVVANFPEEEEEVESELPRICVVGRPNAGKSSFVNLLLGAERSIVTDVAGTTRDSINAHYNIFGQDFILTDTAGLRRKAKVKENIEFYSVMRAVRAIENSDVCIVMIDATRGLESQDLSIISLAQNNRKGIVIMVNKWDLMEKETNTARDYEKEIKTKLGGNEYIPVIFTSVLTKQRVFKAIEVAVKVNENKKRRIPTSKLNDVLLKEIERTPPPAHRGHHIKIKYITQLPTHSPVFAFFCNHPTHIKESYTRFLINKIRENFEFEGIPLKIVYRKK